MKQLDYLKIKIENIEALNAQYLTEHPTIKNRYKLIDTCIFKGSPLYGKNIDIYQKNNTVYISTSVPYLIYGHNFTGIDSNDVRNVLECLSEILDINILEGKVIDFEVAFLFDSQLQIKNLISTISGVEGLELQKKTPSFVAYGKRNTQLKIYNIYHNLKNKLSKTVISSIPGLNLNSIKIELKLTKDKRYTIKQLLEYGLDENLEVLNQIIENRINYTECNYEGSKFDDILYKALLKANKYTYKNVDDIVLEIIDSSPISYSQKTARRKSLKEKQLKAQLVGKKSFKDLLKQSCCLDLPF